MTTPRRSPEAALSEWLNAWRLQDWDALVMASQPHWRLRHPDPRGALVRGYEQMWVTGFIVPKHCGAPVRITNTAAPLVPGSPAFILYCDMSVRIHYQFMEGTRPVRKVSTRVMARLVHERADGTPAEMDDLQGRWYVNPISMSKENASQTHVLPLKVAPA